MKTRYYNKLKLFKKMYNFSDRTILNNYLNDKLEFEGPYAYINTIETFFEEELHMWFSRSFLIKIILYTLLGLSVLTSFIMNPFISLTMLIVSISLFLFEKYWIQNKMWEINFQYNIQKNLCCNIKILEEARKQLIEERNIINLT